MRYLGTLFLSLILSSLTFAQVSPDTIFKQAASRLSTLMSRFDEKDLEWFSPDFFTGVPRAKLIEGLADTSKLLGPIQRTRICHIHSATYAELELIGQVDKRVRVVVRTESTAPYRFLYLMFAPVDLASDTWDKLTADLQKLPGEHAVSVWKLTPAKTRIYSTNPDKSLAIGSSFKLLLLDLLCDEVSAGKRKWSDIVTLQTEGISLPSGLLQDWPLGSPLTLHTLAAMMVSRSDNTAADHLMLTLSRDKIEQHLLQAQVQRPELNRPFLRTSEQFKLKLILPSGEADAYAKSTEEEKRKFLTRLETIKLAEPRINQLPNKIDQIEWFFTTDDLARLLDRIRQSPQQSTALPLLAITRPFDLDDYAWDYLGFKGGAETGVLNLSLLGKLRATQDWFALSLTWNHTKQPLDEPTWLRLAQRALLLIERSK